MLLPLLSGQHLYAQQQSTSSLPQTRNPQSSQAELFNQQSELQESGDMNTLQSGASRIALPAGPPANVTSAEHSSDGRSTSEWLVIGGIVTLGLGTLLIAYAYRQDETVSPSAPEPTTQSGPTNAYHQEPTNSVAAKKAAKKKRKSPANKQARGKKKH